MEPTEENSERVKQLIGEWWGISGREDLLQNLVWIEAGGHRQDFERAGSMLSSLNSLQYQALLKKAAGNEQMRNQILTVKKYYQQLGNKSLMGWDYSRYISLCRWGYVAGYLTEDEAWTKIMPVARKLQQTFASWQELGDNYLIGRKFWFSNENQKNGQYYTEACQRLLNGPESCWNRIPWNTSLDSVDQVNLPNNKQTKT